MPAAAAAATGGGSEGEASLIGTVRNESTGTVISNATVSIDQTTTTTGTDGTYSLINLSTGTYTFTVSMTGYLTYQASVTLIEGSNTKNASLTHIIPSTTIIVENGDAGEPPPAPGEPDDPPVDPPNPPTTILRGTVTGELQMGKSKMVGNDPIPDVLIILGGEGNSQLNGGGLETFTNGQGVYQFNNPPTGNQLIRALKDGYNEYNNNVEVIQNQTTIHDIEIQILN